MTACFPLAWICHLKEWNPLIYKFMKCHPSDRAYIIVSICIIRYFIYHAYYSEGPFYKFYWKTFQIWRYFWSCIRWFFAKEVLEETWNMLDILMRPFDNGFIFGTIISLRKNNFHKFFSNCNTRKSSVHNPNSNKLIWPKMIYQLL